jgi:hypothetical protein
MGYSLFPAAIDKTAGYTYYKIQLYGSDVHLHVLFSTEPAVSAPYIASFIIFFFVFLEAPDILPQYSLNIFLLARRYRLSRIPATEKKKGGVRD